MDTSQSSQGYKYFCSKCNWNFQSDNLLVAHLLSHVDSEPIQVPIQTSSMNHTFKCDLPLCGKETTSAMSMEMHKVSHSRVGPFLCPMCLKSMQRKPTFLAHIRKHNETLARDELVKRNKEMSEMVFKCGLCNATFDTEVKLISHQRSLKSPLGLAKSTQVLHFQCCYCPATFRFQVNLIFHINKHHQNIRPNTAEKYVCQFCDISFDTKLLLDEHVETHVLPSEPEVLLPNHLEDLTDLNFTIKLEPGIEYFEDEHTKEFECGYCGYICPTFADLNDHLTTHSISENIVCDICISSVSKAFLEDHLNMHIGLKNHLCDNCEAAFSYKQNLNIHIQSHALENKPSN